MKKIKVISPDEIENNLFLIKEIINFFNKGVVSKSYIKNDSEMILELKPCLCNSQKALDKAIELINESGWEARHASSYSINACPSYAIFFEIKK